MQFNKNSFAGGADGCLLADASFFSLPVLWIQTSPDPFKCLTESEQKVIRERIERGFLIRFFDSGFRTGSACSRAVAAVYYI